MIPKKIDTFINTFAKPDVETLAAFWMENCINPLVDKLRSKGHDIAVYTDTVANRIYVNIEFKRGGFELKLVMLSRKVARLYYEFEDIDDPRFLWPYVSVVEITPISPDHSFQPRDVYLDIRDNGAVFADASDAITKGIRTAIDRSLVNIQFNLFNTRETIEGAAVLLKHPYMDNDRKKGYRHAARQAAKHVASLETTIATMQAIEHDLA